MGGNFGFATSGLSAVLFSKGELAILDSILDQAVKNSSPIWVGLYKFYEIKEIF